ncbi:gastrin/cholecystokinin type B receptor-like [Haliotis rufescens]|uniref:gastrin/cholecystokinin type B receptor-like n=1 Tax=Haliotis rufescens TaxID=6454 RepID=UPI00201F32BF|nr:gastrin/cholecystokinin type B receptor-like [Haliotis rufescens]
MRSSAANYFLVNLAIADILVAVCCIPLTVADIVYQVWIFGETLCKLTGYLQGIYIGASVLTIVCMGIDRYFAIRHPMIHRRIFTVGKVKILVGLTWLLAAGVMVPLAIVRQLRVHTIEAFSLKYCTEQWPRQQDRQIYDIFLLFFIYIIPGSMIVLLYALMGCKLWRRDASLRRQNSCMNNEAKVMLSRRRLALMMIIISVLFAVCWLPYYIFSICMDFDQSMQYNLITLYPFTLLLGHTNSAQNPILYCFMHKGFKTCILRIIKCQCSRIRYEKQISISRGFSASDRNRDRNSALSPMLRREMLRSSNQGVV